MNVLAGVETQCKIRVRFEMRIVDIPKRDHVIHGAIEIGALFAQHFRNPQQPPFLYFAASSATTSVSHHLFPN
jgi:hypothetical protein